MLSTFKRIIFFRVLFKVPSWAFSLILKTQLMQTLPALHIEDIGETPGAIFETPGTPWGWRFGHIWEADSHSLHPQNVSRVLDIARDTPPPLHLPGW